MERERERKLRQNNAQKLGRLIPKSSHFARQRGNERVPRLNCLSAVALTSHRRWNHVHLALVPRYSDNQVEEGDATYARVRVESDGHEKTTNH